MANGDIKGLIKGIGQVSHTDTSTTVVASITLPSNIDGIYHVHGEVSGMSATGTSDYTSLIFACVRVDDGYATVMAQAGVEDLGATGFGVGLTTSGSAVRVAVDAASGIRSAGYIYAFGVEQALSIG